MQEESPATDQPGNERVINLERTDKVLSEMPPLSWRIWKNEGEPEYQGVVVMTDSCPEAHHAFLNMEPDPWNIADDGTVTPSVHYLDCGWHDHVKLLGWEPLDA